jgi:GntR family transcriptional regulator, rspAB operon transcriptional repressor
MDKNKIYTELRRSITKGYLKPGERLDIVKLAKHYQTSITPLRDALGLLSQEGLVTIKPRSGYFVCQITIRQLMDLFEVREILETASIQRAVGRISDEQIEQLTYDYTSYDDESYDRYIDENRRFHCLIAKASGNEEIVQMLGRVHDQLARFMFIAFRQTGKTQDTTHAYIIEALRARDAEAVLKAMIDEIRATRDFVLARVMEEQGDSWQIRDLEISRPQTLNV